MLGRYSVHALVAEPTGMRLVVGRGRYVLVLSPDMKALLNLNTNTTFSKGIRLSVIVDLDPMCHLWQGTSSEDGDMSSRRDS